MTCGLWEAKGTDDGLDRESQSKSNRGYPRDYIVFEHSKPAVLFQNCTEAMRVGMARPGQAAPANPAVSGRSATGDRGVPARAAAL